MQSQLAAESVLQPRNELFAEYGRCYPVGMAVSPQEQPALRELVGLAIIAAAVIASQIILTRIFSFVCWYHYTPLIIGVALLGFGFAGTYLSVSDGGATEGREQFLARLEREALAFALALPLSLVLVALVRFESAQIFESLWPVAGLATYLIAMTIPFAAAGLVVCRLIDRHRSRAGRVYGTDLVASALGVVLGMTLLTMIGALAADVQHDGAVAPADGAVARMKPVGLPVELLGQGILVVLPGVESLDCLEAFEVTDATVEDHAVARIGVDGVS